MAKPLLCLLNLRHRWHAESTEDGQRYRRCERCNKIDERGGGGSTATGAPMGM